METKIKVELGDTQKTLFMPVWARAVETKKNNPVLTDYTAIEIIDSVDFDFSQMSKNLEKINQISWIARCKRFDVIIKNFIQNNPNGTIVNIGCGLDTTYERIGNKSIMWYDLDLPDVIDLKKKFLKETKKHKFISASFLDTGWFDEIPINTRILFIAAGVFVYFEEAEIKDFMIELADKFNGSELFFDVTSPKGVKIANDVILKSGLDTNAFFKWGINSKNEITSWDKRIRLIDTYYTYKIQGLHLSLRNRITGLISDLLNIQYMVHLQISK